jgi:hypothetical protein
MGAARPFIYKNGSIAPIQIVAPTIGLGNVQRWQAFECELHPVVRSFRAKVSEGVYGEEALDAWHNGDLSGSIYDGQYSMTPPWGPEKGMEHDKTFNVALFALQMI